MLATHKWSFSVGPGEMPAGVIVRTLTYSFCITIATEGIPRTVTLGPGWRNVVTGLILVKKSWSTLYAIQLGTRRTTTIIRTINTVPIIFQLTLPCLFIPTDSALTIRVGASARTGIRLAS